MPSPCQAQEIDAVFDLCAKCARDAVLNGTKDHDTAEDHEQCEIIARAFRADDDEEIPEWSFEQGTGYKCTMFVDLDREAVATRCQLTIDMFGEGK